MHQDQRFDGWKAIANFLGRERTTANRWARERGLPVHRVPGGRTGTVYALRSELEAWLASDCPDRNTAVRTVVETDRVPSESAQNRLGHRGVPVALAVIFICAAIASLWTIGRAPASARAPVSIAAVTSSTANLETIEFDRALTADLARFANASSAIAIIDREPGAAFEAEYAVRTEIERTNDKAVVQARLVAVKKGEVIWSQRFEKTGPALSGLRERVAANVAGILRCGFGGLETARSKVTPSDLVLIMGTCQALQVTDLSAARFRAREITRARPDLAIGWALLAIAEGTLASYENNAAMRVQAQASAQHAVKIAPDDASTRLALAAAVDGGYNNPNALPILIDALRLHPNDPSLLLAYSITLFNLGYLQASVAPALRAAEAETSLNCRDAVVRRLAAAGRTEEALSYQSENERLWPDHPQILEARARFTAPWGNAGQTALQALRNYERQVTQQPYAAYMLARIHEHAGNRRLALEWLGRASTENVHHQWSLLFWPDAAGLRTEPAFFHKMADLGLVRWWIARGEWPDFCAEPGLKYDCRTEARKLEARKPRSS